MSGPERLDLLRADMLAMGATAFVLPEADEHLSEYLADHSRRLTWATGFTGSRGTLVLLRDSAHLLVDGRYLAQAKDEVRPGIDVCASPPLSPMSLIAAKGVCGAVAFDPWLHSVAEVAGWRRDAPDDVSLASITSNPIDRHWNDRPARIASAARAHPMAFAGASSAQKRRQIATALDEAGAGALVLTHLDSIAWLLNIRAGDLPFTPVLRASLIVERSGAAALYAGPARIGADIRKTLGHDVSVHSEDAFCDALRRARGPVLIDPAMTPHAVVELIQAPWLAACDPTLQLRAKKNASEIEGARAAHLRDAIALAQGLHWLDSCALADGADELAVAARFDALRAGQPRFRGLSFATIAASGPNAALPHYLPKPGSARRLNSSELFLLDSGGQYDDGTTDVTRTVALGKPAAAQREWFTRALKGHLAIVTRRFPPGTTGGELDPLARQHLWEVGQDYATGTGHGLGSFLSVHEGPVFIGRRGGTRSVDEALFAGLILTVEPGCYLEGRLGVRTENAYLIEADAAGWLTFSPLTLAPIDRRLIDPALLSKTEIEWIDRYHEAVFASVSPYLEAPVRGWLHEACAPL